MDGSWAELAAADSGVDSDDEELDFPGNDYSPRRKAHLDLRKLESEHFSGSRSEGSQSATSTPRGKFFADDWDEEEDVAPSSPHEAAGGALCSGGAVAPSTPSSRLQRWPLWGYIPPVRFRLQGSWDFSHLAPVDPDPSDDARMQRELAFAALDARREWQRQLGASILRELSTGNYHLRVRPPPH